ncbi:MAG: hypothetical protein ACRDQU_16030 [Pseudonocardiaceae bacterium]
MRVVAAGWAVVVIAVGVLDDPVGVETDVPQEVSIASARHSNT